LLARSALSQMVQQDIGIPHLTPKRALVGFTDNHCEEIQRGKPLPHPRTGAVWQDRCHFRGHPAKAALSTRAAAMRSPSFHPTARWTIVTSSVSPERAETTVRHPRDRALSSAALVSVIVPAWFG